MDEYLQPLPWAKRIAALHLTGHSHTSNCHAHIIYHLTLVTSPLLPFLRYLRNR